MIYKNPFLLSENIQLEIISYLSFKKLLKIANVNKVLCNLVKFYIKILNKKHNKIPKTLKNSVWRIGKGHEVINNLDVYLYSMQHISNWEYAHRTKYASKSSKAFWKYDMKDFIQPENLIIKVLSFHHFTDDIHRSLKEIKMKDINLENYKEKCLEYKKQGFTKVCIHFKIISGIKTGKNNYFKNIFPASCTINIDALCNKISLIRYK